jgi:Caspase domain
MDGTRSALIVASDTYTDPGLRRLRAPASDAQALAGVLENPQIGGFQVHTLLNEPAHEINLAVEEFFAERRPDDLLLLHVSCHGVKDEAGELYFAAANSRLRRLAATAVAAEFVNRRMSRSRSRRVVLLLDCCYAGAFERGMTARAGTGVGIEEQFGGRGRAVITASSAMEYAFEGDQLADTQELAPSVFTSALVEGLETGEADRDQDGMVALGELYDYVYDKVREATPNQTPGKWMFGVQGDLYIARRAHPVTTPAPLPPELQEAIGSPFAGVRTGAVPELARLLRSRHAGLALAARLTLERLADDDSRATSAAATAALGAQAQPAPPELVPPKLTPSTSVIDFGQLPEHSKSPEQRVRLSNAGGGTLNARATTQASWLELRQEAEELGVRVDTTMVGEHEGVVTVDSDGGSATIRVLARVDPTPLPAPEPAMTTHPEPGSAAPDRGRSGAQKDATLSDTSKAPRREPTVAAPMTATPVIGVARPAAGRPRRATRADRHTQGGQAGDDRRSRVVAGRVMLILGLLLLLLGWLTGVAILETIGLILIVIGPVLWIRGSMGRPVGGHRTDGDDS